MKDIIGIGGSIHDFATCLITHDGQIVAIEDERLTRVRYALNSPNPCQPSLEYCLNWSGLQLDEVDEIVGNDMLELSIDPRKYSKLTLINHHLTHAYSTFRDHVNHNIKQREWFRPLAPVVTDVAAKTYFEALCPSPYMQFVWPVREEFRALLPGITHIDGGARVQTVSISKSPSFYTLIEEFGQLSEVPVLLNTSFNTQGAPIVETPSEAIDTFLHSQIDALVLDEFLVTKR